MRRLFLVTAFILGFAVFQSKPAEAFFIEGTFNLSGDVIITTTGLLDFIPPTSPDSTGCPSASCGIEDIQTSTGYFSVFNGDFVYHVAELDLLATDFPATGCTAEQLAAFPTLCGSFDELADFETTPDSIQFSVVPITTVITPAICTGVLGGTVSGTNCLIPATSALPELTFSLTQIDACAIGCNFGFAPQFNVVVTDEGTTIVMNVLGIVCDPGTPGAECTPYQGLFSAQFPGQDPVSLFAQLEANGFIQTSFSASKISAGPSTVPEPATLLLFGTGSAIVASRARRRAKAKKEAEDRAKL